MTGKYPRLAVRGLLLHQDKLLLVNAWPGKKSDLWCAPGGGVDPGKSLPDNLIREFYEETGLDITVGAPALVNEFHDPGSDFHQVDIYFHCDTEMPEIAEDWVDPEGVVHSRRFVSRTELAGLRVKPDSLAEVAWGTGGIAYDPLEPIVR
ncbi:NUDIX hydrolase [Ovoidimarina sediminis]|uniref:NUDIX hydrolase n=1 Tax=Ovoidimarina sediminis TaxID=3079856 RepID=UPI002914AFC3|nr:NUDIX hydrolase [Rhodophyticola sp. MJ-SS7]MDU8944737.1 NUDIX hydrolase [Rhodophyticola sp. MJ-SS7]